MTRRKYNETSFGGLENILANSYVNACLQGIYFIPDLRVALLEHLCRQEDCLSCELAFLFRMVRAHSLQLDGAKGANFAASNFLRVFRQHPQALALGTPRWLTLGLLDSNVTAGALQMGSNFNRFLLEQMRREVPGVQRIFETEALLRSQCFVCGREVVQPNHAQHHNLHYTSATCSFEEALQAGLLR